MENWLPFIPKLKGFWCSCNLREGTVIIGWFGVIWNVMNLLACSILLTQYEMSSTVSSLYEELPFIRGYDIDAFLIAMIVECVVTLLLYGLLLYGAHNKKPNFLLPYLRIEFYKLLIISVYSAYYGLNSLVVDFDYGVTSILTAFLVLALLIYFWMVVFSYHRQLKNVFGIPFVV